MNKSYRSKIELIKNLESVAPKEWLPAEGIEPKSHTIIYLPLVKGTRSYIEESF